VLNPAGGSFFDGSVGYRFNQAYSFLLWKLDTLNPDEEARITGFAYGSVLVQGNTQAGDTITLAISGAALTGSQSFTVTAGPQDTALTLAVAIANAVNQNLALTSVGFVAVAPYGVGPYSYRPGLAPLSEVAIQNAQAFTLAVSSTGYTSAALTTNGAQLHPRAVLTDPATNVVTTYYGYLPILDALETGAVGTSEDLSTLKADVWTARMDELEEREKLYQFWRIRLSRFLYVPLWETTSEGMLGSYSARGNEAVI
jgi:hypothetical protein